jgi:hypothetical protein
VSELTDQDADLYAVSAARLRKERPRFVITCDGTERKPHRPAIVAVYAREDDDDGTWWMPIHSAVRGEGKDLILPETGHRPESNQFDWPCPNRRCDYRFRADAVQVSKVLADLMDNGDSEASLRRLDSELRHAQ